jgi:phosphatidylinositol glycan class S
LHNFTFETQIQYFSPLAIELHRDEGAGTLVEENDLRAFVNNADWNLGESPRLAYLVLQLTQFAWCSDWRHA